MASRGVQSLPCFGATTGSESRRASLASGFDFLRASARESADAGARSVSSTPLALSVDVGAGGAAAAAATAPSLLTASALRSLAAERRSATSLASAASAGAVASTAAPAPACTLSILAERDLGPVPFHASISATEETHLTPW